MTHTEESLMALALSIQEGNGGMSAIRLAIREVLAERNTAIANMQIATVERRLERERAEKAEAECERLRNLLREARQCVHKEANDEREMEGRGYYCDLAERIDAAIKEQP